MLSSMRGGPRRAQGLEALSLAGKPREGTQSARSCARGWARVWGARRTSRRRQRSNHAAARGAHAAAAAVVETPELGGGKE